MHRTRREVLTGLLSAACPGAQQPDDPIQLTGIQAEHRSRTIALRADDITAIPAFHAELTGNLKPPPLPRPSLNADFGVEGFSSPRDSLIWTVRPPADGDYAVAVLYNGANEALQGCQMEIKAAPGGTVLREALRERWWAPERPWVARHRLTGTLRLKQGDNRIALHLPTVSAVQTKLGTGGRDDRRGAQNRDLRVWSIELARPQALASIERRARDLHSSHRWMVEGKYGLFTHFSPLTYPFHGTEMAFKRWQWGVESFDVRAYADAVEETGAKWVLFTTSHGLMYWPGPNRTIDQRLPGRTSKRDLIMDLADELGRRGVRLCLYLHFAATDAPWRKAAGFDDESNARMADTFAGLLEETSRRYGKKLWGFPYIDDGFFRAYQHDPPWERWARAIKAGNREALAGFSPNRGPNVSPFNDLQVGDSGTGLPEPAPARMFAAGEPLEGLEPGWFIAIDAWRTRQPFNGVFHDKPRHSREEYAEYFRKMAAARVPVTANLAITQDVTRKQPFFNPASLDVMRAVKKAVRG